MIMGRFINQTMVEYVLKGVMLEYVLEGNALKRMIKGNFWTSYVYQDIPC